MAKIGDFIKNPIKTFANSKPVKRICKITEKTTPNSLQDLALHQSSQKMDTAVTYM